MSNLYADSRYGSHFAFYPLPQGDIIEATNWKNAFAVLEQADYIIMLMLGWVYMIKAKHLYHAFVLILFAAIIFTTLPHIILEVNGRYHHALVPLLGVAAGLGGWQLTERAFAVWGSKTSEDPQKAISK